MKRTLIAVFSQLLLIPVAFGYGELRALEGAKVLMAGDIKQLTCPIGGNYNCLTWPHNLFQMEGRDVCFVANVSCGFRCEGFIAEKGGAASLYVLGSYPKLASSNIQIYKCPSQF